VTIPADYARQTGLPSEPFEVRLVSTTADRVVFGSLNPYRTETVDVPAEWVSFSFD
jgi:hypothetical protein